MKIKKSTTRTLMIVVAGIVIIAATLMFRRPNLDVQLMSAAERGTLGEVQTLIKEGADINAVFPTKFGWTPLMAAIFCRNTNVVCFLVQAGANVNTSDKRGVTPLMMMTSWGDDAVPWVSFLIANGAELHSKDSDGLDVLAYAKGDPPKPALIKTLESAMSRRSQ